MMKPKLLLLFLCAANNAFFQPLSNGRKEICTTESCTADLVEVLLVFTKQV
jgi:hypothetical protein